MKFLTTEYKKFEEVIAFTGYSLIAILGLIFLLGLVNPIYIPSANELVNVEGEIEQVEVDKYYISISLKNFEQYNLKYLKRSGDWEELANRLDSSMGKYMHFVCSNKNIYFRIPEDPNSCFVFEVKSKDDLIRNLDVTLGNTGKLNTYFFIFGIILFAYGTLKVYLSLRSYRRKRSR